MYALICWLEGREVTACCWVLVPRYIKKSLMVVTSYGFSHSPLAHVVSPPNQQVLATLLV